MVLSREQLLSLIDMLDEWVYQNKLDKANYSESLVTCGNFKNMYRINPFKTLCKLIVTHYKSIVYKDDKHSLRDGKAGMPISYRGGMKALFCSHN